MIEFFSHAGTAITCIAAGTALFAFLFVGCSTPAQRANWSRTWRQK